MVRILQNTLNWIFPMEFHKKLQNINFGSAEWIVIGFILISFGPNICSLNNNYIVIYIIMRWAFPEILRTFQRTVYINVFDFCTSGDSDTHIVHCDYRGKNIRSCADAVWIWKFSIRMSYSFSVASAKCQIFEKKFNFWWAFFNFLIKKDR